MQSRGSWGARRGSASHDSLAKRVLVVHHSVTSGQGIDTFSEQAAHMRFIQQLHFDRGFSDIGYLGVVFQPFRRLRRSRAFVGRGHSALSRTIQRLIPAANPPNSGSIPVCVVGNFEHDRVRRGTKRRLIRIAKNVKREFGVTHVCGHRNINSTTCPGRNLQALVDDIARAAGLRIGDPRTLIQAHDEDEVLQTDAERFVTPFELGCFEDCNQ